MELKSLDYFEIENSQLGMKWASQIAHNGYLKLSFILLQLGSSDKVKS